MTYIHDNKENKDEKDYLEQIRKQAVSLAELLVETPEYQQYIKARNILAADEEQSSVLDELRQEQISLRMAAMLGEEAKEENDDFDKLFTFLSGNPVISEYLFAEGRLIHLIAGVEDVFSDKLELGHFSDGENYDYNSYLN